MNGEDVSVVGRTPPPPTCPDCGRTFTFASALGQHRGWCRENPIAKNRQVAADRGWAKLDAMIGQPDARGLESAFLCEPCGRWHPILWRHIGVSLHRLAPVEVPA